MTDWKEEMRPAVAAEVAKHGEVRPPWVEYPDIGRYSIGWRMGSGESYMMTWWVWFENAFADLDSRCAYFEKHDPPVQWLDWIAIQLWPEREDREAGVKELATLGIGNYAEWRAWAKADDESST